MAVFFTVTYIFSVVSLQILDAKKRYKHATDSESRRSLEVEIKNAEIRLAEHHGL